MDEKQQGVIHLLDRKSGLRRNFIRKKFANSIDQIRFYDLIAKTASFPVLGTLFVRPILNLYNRYIETNCLVLPLDEIERVIASADQLFVDPCDCRVEYGRCDSPLFTCMRINFGAQVRQEMTGRKGLTRDEALRVARNAHQHGLVLIVEQCLQPYQLNICMCCPCCCIQFRLRYKYGLRALESGPHVPTFDHAACNGCGTCADRCPAHALSRTNAEPVIASKDCLGCGICESACPEHAIRMKLEPERIRKDVEPGWIRLLLVSTFMYTYMFPMFLLFRLFGGSHQYKQKQAVPNRKDVVLGVLKEQPTAAVRQAGAGSEH
jgi:ferredoxin